MAKKKTARRAGKVSRARRWQGEFADELSKVDELLDSVKAWPRGPKESSLGWDLAERAVNGMCRPYYDHDERVTKFVQWACGECGEEELTMTEWDLQYLLLKAAQEGVKAMASHFRGTLEKSLCEYKKRLESLRDRTEHGEMLAAEGRNALDRENARRADRICRLYQRIRSGYAPGRAGNGQAIEAVRQRIGPIHGRDKPIDKTAVRRVLKNAGLL